MTRNPFSQFEDRVQYLLEGSAARLSARRLYPHELALQVTKALEDHVFCAHDGQMVAPDAYRIRLNPQDHAAILDARPDIIIHLTAKLLEMARMSNISLASSPKVKLLVDSALGPHQVDIRAWSTTDSLESTQSMQLGSAQEAEPAPIPQAMLIFNGQHISINLPVLNLGRHRDNHIIIDDPTVSRHHIQMRLRFGHYVLFDVSGRGSTVVNGTPIQEVALQSGDVIGVGNSNLIYIADELADDPQAKSTAS